MSVMQRLGEAFHYDLQQGTLESGLGEVDFFFNAYCGKGMKQVSFFHEQGNLTVLDRIG